MADQQAPTMMESNTIAAPVEQQPANVVESPSMGLTPATDEPSAKRVRLEDQPTTNATVAPLGGNTSKKNFNYGVDINTLSMAEMREEMAGIVNLAKELGTSVDALGLDEQSHYFAMLKGLKDRHDTANKYMQMIKEDSQYNQADLDNWIDMLRSNEMDPRSKDSIASFAAANQRYSTKKVEEMRLERDAAIKRAHDFEAQLECLKKDGGTKQQQQNTGFLQQEEKKQQPKGLSQPVFHSQSTTMKAVDSYYNQFGDARSGLPFGQASYDLSKNSFASVMSQHILKHLGNPENTSHTEKYVRVNQTGSK